MVTDSKICQLANVAEYVGIVITDGLTLAVVLFIFVVVLPTTFLLLLYMGGVMLQSLFNNFLNCFHGVTGNIREIWSYTLGGLTGFSGLNVDPWTGPFLFVMCALTYIYYSLKPPATLRTAKLVLFLMLISVVAPLVTSTTTATTSSSTQVHSNPSASFSSAPVSSFSTVPSTTSQSQVSTVKTSDYRDAKSRPDLCQPAEHSGPAGSSYTTIRSAGRQLLINHCEGFPNTAKSFILPPSSRNKFCEPCVQPRPNLTRKEEKKLTGMRINQEGERHEKTVSDLFIKMIKQTDVSPPILVLKNVSIDNDHKSHTKETALKQEIPGLDFNTLYTKGENDLLVLIQYTGIALVEIKGSSKITNITSAEQQLKRMNLFIQCIFKAVARDSMRKFPIVQLICIPDEEKQSPSTLTPEGSLLLFKNICDDFNASWMKIIEELRNVLAANPFTLHEFEELSETMVGVWGSKAHRIPFATGKKMFGLSHEDFDASLAYQIKNLDLQLNTADIPTTSKQSQNTITNISPTQPTDIFQTSNDMKLLYLSPPQRELFDLHQQCIVRGAAGTGKSLILMFKILQLLEEFDFRDILVLAPFPHNYRIRNYLLSNNHLVEIINRFPPPSDNTTHMNNTRNIYIMTLEEFFYVDCDTLMSFDISQYHMFVDDLQSLRFFNANVTTSFYDVGNFIDKWYESCRNDERYLWVLMDVVQSYLWSNEECDGKLSHYLFLTPQHNPRTFNMPIVHLNHIMRNTTDIAKLNNEYRGWYINDYNASSHVLSTPSMGHNISGQVPTYHKLQPLTDEHRIIYFIIERVREELLLVTKPPYSLPLSDVAILWGDDADHTHEKYTPAVRDFLNSEFNTTPITIEQQLITNNTTDIIMDSGWLTVSSFESPCVIYIKTRACLDYNSYTRARTYLTIIDAITYPLKHTNLVHWKPNNNTFIKYMP